MAALVPCKFLSLRMLVESSKEKGTLVEATMQVLFANGWEELGSIEDWEEWCETGWFLSVR